MKNIRLEDLAHAAALIDTIASILAIVDWISNRGFQPIPVMVIVFIFSLVLLLIRKKFVRVFAFFSILIVSSWFVWYEVTAQGPPSAPNCYEEFCEVMNEDGDTLGQIQGVRNFEDVGKAVQFKVDLSSSETRSSTGMIVKSIEAADGDVLLLKIMPEEDAPPNLAAQILLKDGQRVISESSRQMLKPGEWNDIAFKIKDSIGSIPVKMDLYLILTLESIQSLPLPRKWNGLINISAEPIVQVTPNPLPTITPQPTSESPSETRVQQTKLAPGEPISQPTATPLPCSGRDIAVEKIKGPVDWLYITRAGDDFSSLAKTFMLGPGGDREIYEKNKKVVGYEWVKEMPPLFAGQELIIYNVESPILHTVRDGDTLQGISALYYGYGAEAAYCSTVYLPNREIIGDDPSRLSKGQVLRIYPLAKVKGESIRVRTDDSMAGYAWAFYLDQTVTDWLCLENSKPDGLCDHLLPFEVVHLPNALPGKPYTVRDGDNWESIARGCFGTYNADLARALQLSNRDIVGNDPALLHAGQELKLRGCK